MKQNPSLLAQPRHQVSSLIKPRGNASIYDWIEQNHRFMKGEEQGTGWSADEEELMAPLLEATNDDDEDALAA